VKPSIFTKTLDEDEWPLRHCLQEFSQSLKLKKRGGRNLRRANLRSRERGRSSTASDRSESSATSNSGLLIVTDENDRLVGSIPLTANLKNAVGDLRNRERLSSKVFWIDQICIDQEGG
jgi:hypothetical protein